MEIKIKICYGEDSLKYGHKLKYKYKLYLFIDQTNSINKIKRIQ